MFPDNIVGSGNLYLLFMSIHLVVFALEQLSSPFRLTVTIRQKDFSQSVEAGVGDSESQLAHNQKRENNLSLEFP